MAAPADITALGRFCTVITVNSTAPNAQQLAAWGFLVQGPDSPCIVTCYHCFEQYAGIGNQFRCQFVNHPTEILECRILDGNNRLDFLILEVVSPTDRTTAPVDLSPSASFMGSPYDMLGYSTRTASAVGDRMAWTFTRGVISTVLLDDFFVGYSGGNSPAGDSGGPLFHGETRRAIGVNVSMSLLAAEASAEMTASPQGRFLPLYLIELAMSVKTGIPFFGAGGLPAVFRQLGGGLPQPWPLVPRRSDQMLCTLGDLLDPDILDPYQ